MPDNYYLLIYLLVGWFFLSGLEKLPRRGKGDSQGGRRGLNLRRATRKGFSQTWDGAFRPLAGPAGRRLSTTVSFPTLGFPVSAKSGLDGYNESARFPVSWSGRNPCS